MNRSQQRGPKQRRKGPARQQRRIRACELHGGCMEPAVAYYVTTTLLDETVSLYACVRHDPDWQERHPDMARHEMPSAPT